MHFTPRDGEALRRIQTVWRWLGAASLTSNYAEDIGWQPFTQDIVETKMQQAQGGAAAVSNSVFASRWVSSGSSMCAWTVVNRDTQARSFSLTVPTKPAVCGAGPGILYDLIAGKQVAGKQSWWASLQIEGMGYGCYLFLPTASPTSAAAATTAVADAKRILDLRKEEGARQAGSRSTALPAGLSELLITMSKMTVGGTKPLSSYSEDWAPVQQKMVTQPTPTVAA
jgi:hypothetical protein